MLSKNDLKEVEEMIKKDITQEMELLKKNYTFL